jgi:hypothetical protein
MVCPWRLRSVPTSCDYPPGCVHSKVATQLKQLLMETMFEKRNNLSTPAFPQNLHKDVFAVNP